MPPEDELAATARLRVPGVPASAGQEGEDVKGRARPGAVGRRFAFIGPAFLVAVGYMDPGNWATDLAAGSAYGYRLLPAVLLAGLVGALLQSLSARLGIATGRDLAQSCRENFSRPVGFGLWVLAEIGICACDLAEVLGTALALRMLFDIPLLPGVLLTLLDVLLVLGLQRRGLRGLEAAVAALMLVVAVCFAIELAMVGVSWPTLLADSLPSLDVFHDGQMLYLALGIVGATVMPHNLYLHSSVVSIPKAQDRTDEAMRWSNYDIMMALSLAILVNGAILMLAAAGFHANGQTDVADISQAHRLLLPLLGPAAATLFAVALLASGLNATLTATMAGQIVMEGFVRFRLPAWKRRLLTRLLAVAPAVLAVALDGEAGLGRLLILSQVVLALQLPFAAIPLVMFTCDKARMGRMAPTRLFSAVSWSVVLLLSLLNGWLLFG